jgi:hypothetical protein
MPLFQGKFGVRVQFLVPTICIFSKNTVRFSFVMLHQAKMWYIKGKIGGK